MAFASPCIQRGRVLVAPPKGETVKAEYLGAKSLHGYSGITYGIPAITVEIGGSGVNSALEPEWIKENLRGIKNVMKHLKIFKGDMEKPEKILFSRTRTDRLNPRNGGFLVPEKHPETLLRKVIKGEVLGRVINAFTFVEVEQIISPCNGYLVYCSIPRPVRPGDYAFGVFDDSDVEFIKP